MGSFCKNHIKFDLKMYRRVISHDTEEWCKVKRKTDSWFQVWHEEFCEFSPDHSKVQKFHFDGPFLSKVYEVWAKKYRGVTFYDTKQWWKIWINFDSVVWKIAWGIGWTFIRALKSLKNCALMGSFLSKGCVSVRKLQRNYVSWHWRVMQNSKKNWPVVGKMT